MLQTLIRNAAALAVTLSALALAAPGAQAAPPADADETITVYKSPSCGCCKMWIEHLESEGFTVEAFDSDDMTAIKKELSVPRQMSSCHTAKVGGYTIEGHVPAADIRRLLAEQPDADGLAVPGMPVGSPGMEYGDRVSEVFESYGASESAGDADDSVGDN